MACRWPAATAAGYRLVTILDMPKNDAVAAVGGADAWIGLTQPPSGATSTSDMWHWIGVAPGPSLSFTRWGATQSNDGAMIENGAENTALMKPDGTWDDVAMAARPPSSANRSER